MHRPDATAWSKLSHVFVITTEETCLRETKEHMGYGGSSPTSELSSNVVQNKRHTTAERQQQSINRPLPENGEEEIGLNTICK